MQNSSFSPQTLLVLESVKIHKNSELIEKLICDINDWDNFARLAYAHGIFPLVYKTLKTYETFMSQEVLMKMKKYYMDIVKQSMLMTSELLSIMKLFEENSINAISFKGPLLSQMAYKDISSRQYVDLDILINEKDIVLATKVLTENFYKSEYNLTSYQNQNLLKNVHDVAFYNTKNSVRLECHWTLTSGEFYINIQNWNLFEDVSYVKINNTPVPTVENEKLIVYLCIHGYKHMWERIEWLSDILYLNDNNTVDWKEVLKLAYSIDADRVVLSSLYLCEQMLNMELSNEISQAIKKDKKLLKISQKMLKKLHQSYNDLPNESVHSKYVSYIQLYMLKNLSSQLTYILTLFTPTELDYQVVALPKSLSFFYYAIRPFNILIKSLKSG